MHNKKIVLITLFTLSVLLLTGCAKQVAQVNVNQDTKNENVNVDTVASDEIDTSNWQTYTNEEYGFSFKYPKDWTAEIISPVETYLTDNSDADLGHIKYYIQPYDEAPLKGGLLYSKEQLSLIKNNISNSKRTVIINSIEIESITTASHDEMVLLANFVINNDYIRFSYPLQIFSINHDEMYEYIAAIQNGNYNELPIPNAEQKKVIFDTMVKSIQPL